MGVHATAQTAPSLERMIENDTHAIWVAKWRPNQLPMVPHRHDGPTVIVYVRGGAIRTAAGTLETHRKGDVAYFEPGAVLNSGVLESATLVHALIVELKDRPRAFDRRDGQPAAFPRDGAIELLQNDRVTVWDVTYKAALATPFHVHDKLTLIVWLSAGKLIQTFSDGQSIPTSITPGTFIGLPGRLRLSEAASAEMRAIEIEVKP